VKSSYSNILAKFSLYERGHFFPFQAAREESLGAKWERTYLKPNDLNAAVGVRDRATQKAPIGYDKPANIKQTFRAL